MIILPDRICLVLRFFFFFFFFQCLKYIMLLLACKDFAEISFYLLVTPLYITSCVLPLKFLNFCHFNYGILWCLFLCVHLIWDSLCFLDLDVCFFTRLRKFSAIISSNKFSVPFTLSSLSGTPEM